MNEPIDNHPWIGSRHVYEADMEPYDWERDGRPSNVVLGPGMEVEIAVVFQNWNGVAGLDMLYVYVPTTYRYTHVTPATLGLPPISTTQC